MTRILASFGRTRLALVVLAAAAAMASGRLWADELKEPSAKDRRVCQMVVLLMGKGHLSQHPLDDEISSRAFKAYLKTVDPQKLYFTQADIDQWKGLEKQLDDLANAGDITPAYTVYQRFAQRLPERAQLAQRMIDANHDFTVQEEMATDGDKLAWAKDEAEIADRWRRRIKYELLLQKADKKTLEEAREKLHRRYNSLAKRLGQTTADELLEWYLSAVTTSYDPHSTYMSPSTLDDFEISMRLQLDGIGAALSSEDGLTTVTKIIPGGAASKEGSLKTKDQVLGVGQGESGEIVDVVDMKLRQVVNLIRGKAGTVVRLQVKSQGEAETKIYNITRAKIDLEDSAARSQVIKEGARPDGGKYKIGVIDLPSFYMDMSGARDDDPNARSTTRDVRKILDKFRAEGVEAVVMDLRRNGGGSLIEAINLTGLFIDEGPVVQVKDYDGNVTGYDDQEKGVAWSGPLVVLTSKFSASASEIFAGAIQDYHRGLIVGDKSTHGKGTVQSLMNLGQRLFRGPNAPNLGALKVTMQQFYRPNGESTQKRGVLADVELPAITTHLDVGEGDLDYAVEFDKVDPSKFIAVNAVDNGLIAQLRQLSAQRREKSEDFRKLNERISRYLAQKDRKAVSLNEEKFLADRKELDSGDEEEKEIEKLDDPNRPVVERTFYFNEALNVTIDYLRLQRLAAR